MIRVVSLRATASLARRFSPRHTAHCGQQARCTGTNSSFEDVLKKMKGKFESEGKATDQSSNAADSTSDSSAKSDSNATVPKKPFFILKAENISNVYNLVVDNVKLAWAEMIGEKKESSLKKSVQQAATFRRGPTETKDSEEETVKYEGPTSIVVVKDRGSAWDQMKSRLSESPLIREVLKSTRKISRAAAGTDIGKKAVEAGENVKNKIDDVREYWETSQNPLVYKLSGAWDAIAGDTEEGIAINEIKKFDSSFVKETWSEEIRYELVPEIIKAHLIGDLRGVKGWLGEAVYNKLSADIRARKGDGIVFDPNILDIEENTVIIRLIDGEGPIIVVVYMVQQINCIRNRDGEIIEGGEDQIRAKFYSIAFKQVYDDLSGVVQWTCVDYEFAGDIPYI